MRADYGQFSGYHRHLRDVLGYLEVRTGLEFTITSVSRADGGIHDTFPLRAVDLRCRNKAVGEVLCQLVNDTWQYDYNRPELMVCGFKDNHIHMQVHENTGYRKL